MGKAPAVIIIARHGARLDAVDKTWHLNSPTPYDPPLTYGGWKQSRTLGVQIGNLVRKREERNNDASVGPKDGQDVGTTETTKGSAKKHRIIVHTSPFLRCIQSAIAISSGINQVPRNPLRSSNSSSHSRIHSSSSTSQALGSTTDGTPLSIIPEPSDARTDGSNDEIAGNRMQPCRVRLDAFLGEWLSHDYFENITPPPDSVLMLAGAKGDLLRPAEHIVTASETGEKSLYGYFPGGWGSTATGSLNTSGEGDVTLKNVTTVESSPASRFRSGSLDPSTLAAHKAGRARVSRISTDVSPADGGYLPPTPTYAVGPSDPIPPGYVSHACDACVEIDYQWDSMREPHNWGNGGEYGEEWSSMHERFRNGIQRMVDYYKHHDQSKETISGVKYYGDEDDDTDTVLVLVTHGAGCNALIGALTDQPVLLDIGMSSMTVAVRKPDSEIPKSDHELADEYQVDMLASTEHLRTGEPPSRAGSLSLKSHQTAASTISSYRHRIGSSSGSMGPGDSFASNDSVARRYGTQRFSSLTSPTASASRASSGLWGSNPDSEANSDADDLIPNFGDPSPAAQQTDTKSATPETGAPVQLPERTRSQHGLWGSTSVPQRDPAQKRRWTVTERHA